jgi:hypothetical protein
MNKEILTNPTDLVLQVMGELWASHCVNSILRPCCLFGKEVHRVAFLQHGPGFLWCMWVKSERERIEIPSTVQGEV